MDGEDRRPMMSSAPHSHHFIQPAVNSNQLDGSQIGLDFKSPPAGAPVTKNGCRSLALITPEKRFVSLEQNQVRKRPFPLSPAHGFGNETEGVIAKKKQVAKCLLFPTDSSLPSSTDTKGILSGRSFAGGGVAKCLFGPPSDEENRKIVDQIDNNNRIEFQNFEKRYVIEEVLDVHY